MRRFFFGALAVCELFKKLLPVGANLGIERGCSSPELIENREGELSSDLPPLKFGSKGLIITGLPRAQSVLQFLLAEFRGPIYFAPRPKRITLKVARMMAKSSMRERFLI